MAQQVSRKPMTYGQLLSANNVGVAVTTAALAEILKLIVESQERILVQVKNKSGANAFNAFQISVKANESADWAVLYSTGAAFTAPSGILVGASGDLTILPANTYGWFILDTRGIYAVRVEAKVAAADTTADVYVSGYGQQ